MLGGNSRFVLSNSGHIQSILNPPGNPKATYLEAAKLTSDPRAWYYDAQKQEGSWWPRWLEWIQQRSGEQRETIFSVGSSKHPDVLPSPNVTESAATEEALDDESADAVASEAAGESVYLFNDADFSSAPVWSVREPEGWTKEPVKEGMVNYRNAGLYHRFFGSHFITHALYMRWCWSNKL